MAKWLVALLIGSGVAAAQSPLAGTWLGQLNGVPAVKLTVEQNDGKVGGNVLFYLIQHKPDGREGRVIGDSGVIALRKVVLIGGKRLTFEINGSNGKPKAFEMQVAGEKEASLREAGGGGEGMRMVRE